MKLLEWFSPTRIAILLGLALALLASFGGYGALRYTQGEAAATDRAKTAIEAQKAKAGALLAEETGKVLLLERALRLMTEQVEKENAERTRLTQAYEKRLADAAAAGAGRLRDPNAARCGGGGAGAAGAASAAAGDRAGGGADAGGLLSAPLTRLLIGDAGQSGRINDAYAACRAWAIGVKSTEEKGTEERVVSP